ncbi:MAG: hypothetical protein ACI9K2_007141 [Myxococcota bacterium]|jgi:hypothetical protein
MQGELHPRPHAHRRPPGAPGRLAPRRSLAIGVVRPRVRQTCAGCHLEGSHLDLRFHALATLVEAEREFHPWPIVIPGDADGSLLVRKVEADVGLVTLDEDEGEPMPADAEITLDDAQLIRDWVAAGALVPSGR